MTDIRKDIPAEYKWDITALYADLAAFDAAFEETKAAIVAFSAYEPTMTQDAPSLLAALDAQMAVELQLHRLYEYAQ